MHLILASQSRGRKALLSLLNIPFEVVPSTIDEDKITGKTPFDTIKLRAKLKGEDVASKVQSSKFKVQSEYLILSADSGAILDGQLIGKPKDYDEAIRILNTLSGRRHEFVTAVFLTHLTYNIKHITTKKVVKQENFICEQYVKSFIARSYVTFKKLTPKDIRIYLSMTKYTRYAGAYALFICPKCPRLGLSDLMSKQKYHELLEKTCLHAHIPNLIEKIEGSLSNVIGLPLEKLIPLLANHN